MSERTEGLFYDALALPPRERDVFLAKVCDGDDALRQRIEDLLAERDASGIRSASEIARSAADFAIPSAVDFSGLDTQFVATELPGDKISHYTLLEKIGEGGCGVVYLAEQVQPIRRKVALKVIKLGMDTMSVIARFEAERQALALMDHPCIAKVLDAGATETGRPFFVMELVQGVPLNRYCENHQLTIPERLDLFTAVCIAIQHAHQKGIIHRDIKPTNILVTVQDGAPMPKVIDFGIAKATQSRISSQPLHTEMHAFIGTPAYMSPEQSDMAGLDIDTRADIYSLGVVLYELLAGKPPFDLEVFQKADLEEIRHTIRDVDPPRPSARVGAFPAPERSETARQRRTDEVKLISTLSGDLDWITMKALEKDRGRRYESASAFAQDIKRYLGDEPVLARPPSTTYVLKKLVRRHRAAFAAGTAVAASLVIGLSISLWLYLREREARERAVTAEREQTTLRVVADTERGKAEAERDRADAESRRSNRMLYFANMNLAKRAWDDGSAGRVMEILNLYLPQTNRADLRGFEWHYLRRLCEGDAITLRDHERPVYGVAYSPDGKWIASAGTDRTVRVWNKSTLQPRFVFKAHTEPVRAVAFSHDSKLLATGGADQAIRLWDTSTGRMKIRIPGHKGLIAGLAFSPDGKRIVSACQDETAKLWDVSDGKQLKVFNTRPLTSVAFSSDGKWIAAGSEARVVHIWEVDGTNEFVLSGHREPVTAVAFAPDSKSLASASYDGTTRFWNIPERTERMTLRGHAGRLHALAFSADGARLATGSEDQTIKIWDTKNGQELLTLKGHTRSVRGVAFALNGQQLASTSDDETVKLWDTASTPDALVLKLPVGAANAVAFNRDGTRLASASQDRLTRVWDLASSRELHTLKGNDASVLRVAYSPDGKWLASASVGRKLHLWDALSGELIREFEGNVAALLSVTFSPDGKRLASTASDRSVKIFDTSNGQLLQSLKGHNQVIRDVAFSADGKRLATAAEDWRVKTWNAETGEEISTLSGHKSLVFAVAFSLDGKWLASASQDWTVILWDAVRGAQVGTFSGHTRPVWDVAFTPDSQRIASGGGDGTVRLWDVASGQEALALKGHSDWVRGVAFSRDGHKLASASMDGTIKVWNAMPIGNP